MKNDLLITPCNRTVWAIPELILLKPIFLPCVFWLLTLIVGAIAAVAVDGQVCDDTSTLHRNPNQVKVMAWNIWHGGRENGEQAGPLQVANLIQRSGADLVALQETYGSGEILANATGFNFLQRGTNVSILSRFPIIEDVSVFEPFKCVGAIVQFPNQRKIAFYSIWLPYSGEIWEPGTRNTADPQSMLAACAASVDDLKTIIAEIDDQLAEKGYNDIPVILAGDYNSMSHLDYTAANVDQYKVVVDWRPVTSPLMPVFWIAIGLRIPSSIEPTTVPGPLVSLNKSKTGLTSSITEAISYWWNKRSASTRMAINYFLPITLLS